MFRITAVFLAMSPLAASAAGLTVSAQDWAQLRAAAVLTPPPAFGELLAALERSRDGVVLVRHPSGEPGARWAEALRDFLVARGLPSARIALLPAPFDAEQLELEVRPAGAAN